MELALGTVQFGLDYGVSNTGGRTPFDEAQRILAAARAGGIVLLDTAAAYGDAEDVLARADAQAKGFRIITKTLPLTDDRPVDAVVARARSSIETLGQPLDTLMLHSAADLTRADGMALWRALRRLQAEGATRRLGISVYARDAIRDLVAMAKPEVVQLPASLLDQRLVRDGTIADLSHGGVEVHVRSAFHQGLIFADPAKLPPRLAETRDAVAALQARIAASGLPPVALALSYLRAVPGVHAVVVGVTRRSELEDILAASNQPWPGGDAAAFALDDPLLLDPTRW